MTDKREEQEDQVERKNENGESLCQNGIGGTRVQEKEKQAMV